MRARDSKPDIVITDVELPGLGGLALCKSIRSSPETASIPVIIISGRKTEDADLVSGYDKGADDYLTKPFAFSVLAAKVNAVLRRYSAAGRVDGRIKEKGLEPVQLARKEFDLRTLLMKKRGRVLSVPYLLETVWGYDMGTYDNPHTIETHVSFLRKKMGHKFAERLVSVTGHGYKFE